MWTHKQKPAAALLAALSLFVLGLAVGPAAAGGGKYVTVDAKHGVKLYYEESGSGDPVVFVPGWTMTTPFFEKQLKYFEGSKTTRFIVFDPRAHGRSTKTTDGANYNQHARDLKAFMDNLGLKHVVLGGWSWGMDTVYAYISMYGADNIRAVVNIDQTPYPLATGPGDWKDGDISSVKPFFDDFTKDRAGTTRTFMPTFFATPVSKAELERFQTEAMMTPDVVAGLLYYDGWMFDSTATVKGLKRPQLFFVSQGNAEAAKGFVSRNCPGAEVVSLGEHAMFYDQAAKFNDRLAAFLARNP